MGVENLTDLCDFTMTEFICHEKFQGMMNGQIHAQVKICSHILVSLLSPSRFSIASQTTGRFGLEPILPVDWPVIIDVMLNFDGTVTGTDRTSVRVNRPQVQLQFVCEMIQNVTKTVLFRWFHRCRFCLLNKGRNNPRPNRSRDPPSGQRN